MYLQVLFLYFLQILFKIISKYILSIYFTKLVTKFAVFSISKLFIIDLPRIIFFYKRLILF